MPSITARITHFGCRIVVKRDVGSIDHATRHLRRVFNNVPLPRLLPRGVRVKAHTLGGRDGHHVSVKAPENTILYLHGGGFVAGVTHTYHNLSGQLAKSLNAQVYLPTYRLAPEHPFPSALEDAMSAYLHLLEQGIDPEKLVVAGDSAGGGLTLTLLLKLRDEGLPLPKAAITLSPAADGRGTAASLERNDKTDAMLSASIIRHCADALLDDIDREHPYASPALADYTGLPPLLISVDEHECLRDDAHAVAAKAREAGCRVEMISRKGMFHVWPIFTPFIPEARQDVNHIVQFLLSVGLNGATVADGTFTADALVTA